MPTGYTAQLKDMNYNLRQWLTTVIPRAFGMMVSFRDDIISSKDSIKQLRDKIKNEADNHYHQDALIKAEKKLLKLERRKDSTWKREYYKKRKEDREYTEERLGPFSIDAVEHDNVKHNLHALKEIADNEISQNIINFAIEQIESTIEFDYSESSMPTVSHLYYEGWEKYKEETISGCEWSVNYHTKQRAEEIERVNGRLEAYDDYVKFITQMDRIITKHTYYNFLQQLHARVAEKSGASGVAVASIPSHGIAAGS
jgi:hypothetical protein